MRKSKAFLCIGLALLMCLTLAAPAFAADSEAAAYKAYPTVFVHGLFGWGPEDGVDSAVSYWGMTSGSMMEYLGNKGYTVAAASVGPISSCWDRCCELYAQLTGTRTDYGTAHVEKIQAQFARDGVQLTHQRYGRDYTGAAIVENWGPDKADSTKLNLVGHSFGGPTVTMLLHLLAEGDEAERAAAKAAAIEAYGTDEAWHEFCSPLFWGDYEGENLIHSVTSLAGVLNGTTFIDCCDDTTDLACSLMMGVANLIGDTALNSLYDFQLEQFGITGSANPDYEYTLDILRATSFLDSTDNAVYDLSIAGCNELKQGWVTYDNVYYFAYAGCTTSQDPRTGNWLPNADTWLPLMPFAAFIGSYTNSNEEVLDIYGETFCTVTEDWLPNDGMVNTVTAGYVFGCPHAVYAEGTALQGGIWYTMPSYGFDHMDYGGGLLEPTQNAAETQAFFDEVMNNILATYRAEQLKAPRLTVSSPWLSRVVRLNWDAVEGADTYRIYRATSANGSYSLLKTVSGTGWTDYSVRFGRTYWYRVVAADSLNEFVTSPYSAVENVKVK